MRRGRGVAFWGAVAGVSLMSLFGLNVAADRLNSTAVAEFRDYITRRNG